jgi:hypothetical protein
MSRPLTPAICTARAQAYESCAEHLGLDWTDDPLERAESAYVEKHLRREIERWERAAQERTP